MILELEKIKTLSEECKSCLDYSPNIAVRKDDGTEVELPCSNIKGKSLERIIFNCGISRVFLNKGFHGFNLNDKAYVIKKAYETSVEYVDRYMEIKDSSSNSLALLGKSGCGKTHLLLAICNNLFRNYISFYYFPYQEGIDELKYSFKKMEHIIKQMKNADLLIIDDLFKGREHPTPFQLEKMFGIINYRYLNQKPLLISSEKYIDELLDIDEALGSRIYEMCRDFLVEIKEEGVELNHRLRNIRKIELNEVTGV